MAYLPNREHAYVEESKLTDYLLSDSHPVGRSKAQFFKAAGFDKLNVDILARALVHIAETQAVEDITTGYGSKYVADGTLHSPQLGPLNVRTVWIVDRGEEKSTHGSSGRIRDDVKS